MTAAPARRRTPRTVTVRTAAVTVALLAAGGLAACSGSSGGGSASASAAGTTGSTTSTPTTTTTTSSTPTSTAPTTGSVPGSTAGSSVQAGPAACRESQLKAQIDARPFGPVPKHDRAVVVQFINTSSTSCTIHGYPGAAILDASGHQLVQATRTLRGAVLGLPKGQDTLPTVTLKAGAVASAGIEGVDHQQQGAAQAGCAVQYPRIVVTPPNTTTAVPFTVTWPACYTFTVHPTNIDRTAN